MNTNKKKINEEITKKKSFKSQNTYGIGPELRDRSCVKLIDFLFKLERLMVAPKLKVIGEMRKIFLACVLIGE